MDGIQFSFGIGAFPFAFMGGVSHLYQTVLITELSLLQSFCSSLANASSIWKQTER